jgi:hypothetical protein
LNVSGAGEGSGFTSTFTDDDPHPLPPPRHVTPKGHPAPGTRPCAQGEGHLLRAAIVSGTYQPEFVLDRRPVAANEGRLAPRGSPRRIVRKSGADHEVPAPWDQEAA